MDDSELQAIRQARMAELQKQQGGASGGAQAGGSAGNASNDQQQSVEDLLIRLVRSGQIQKKVSEQELISLLEQLSQQESKANKTKIVDNSTICELTFPTSVLKVKMNRKRLLVILEEQIYIYSLKNMELLHVLPVRSNPRGVCGVCQSPLHPFLAYPGNNPGEVIIFNTDSLEPVTVISAHKSNLAIVSFNPPAGKGSKDDRLLLATASEKGTLIRVFDAVTAQRLYEFRRGSMPTTIFSINFEPTTNKYLIVSSATETVHMFKLGEPAKARLRPSSSETEAPAASANKYFTSVLKMLEPQRDYTCLRIPTNGNTGDTSSGNGKTKNLGSANHINREFKSAAAFCKDMVVVVTSEGYLYQFKFRSPEFKDGELVQQYSLKSM